MVCPAPSSYTNCYVFTPARVASRAGGDAGGHRAQVYPQGPSEQYLGDDGRLRRQPGGYQVPALRGDTLRLRTHGQAVYRTGTTVGHIVAHLFDYGEDMWSVGFEQSQTNFYKAGGAKIAEFVAWVAEKPDGQPFMVKYRLMDYGEPAEGTDKYMICVWVGFWWPMYGSGEPIPFPGGNIQVHFCD